MSTASMSTLAERALITPARKTKWDLCQNPAGLSSRAHQLRGSTMADENVNEEKVADEAVQPVVDPADIEADIPLAGVKTIDSHEVSIGWTAQQGDVPAEPYSVPGTVVTVAELPDHDSMIAAGVDLDQYYIGLHAAVAADDAERDVIRGVK